MLEIKNVHTRIAEEEVLCAGEVFLKLEPVDLPKTGSMLQEGRIG